MCFWKENSKKNKQLSVQTFSTVQHTSFALPFVADYLLSIGLDYVLLGNIQSDSLESRFGWYRQLSGANYFSSVRQFLQSEKTIRVRSLVKYSNLDFKSIKEVSDISATTKHLEHETNAKLISEQIVYEFDPSLLTRDETSILYYISGTTAKKGSNFKKILKFEEN